MLKDLKQFVPSNVCLKCDGCCRFKQSDSRWRPHITESEKKAAAAPGVVEKIFGAHIVGPDSRISTTPCGDEFLCHFFNPKDHACGIYHARPFECQLYPFLIGKKGKDIILYAHLNCPHVQEHWGGPLFKEYSAYIQDFFRKKGVRDHLKQNPGLCADYSAFAAELDHICVIPLE